MDNVTVVAIEGASIATEEGNGRLQNFWNINLKLN